MKTNLRISLILMCLCGCVLIALSFLFRASAEREARTSAEVRPAGFEPASATESKPSLARLRSQRVRRGQEAEPPVAQQQPPDDPDESRQWARENPDLALRWMTSAPAGPQRDTVAEIVCAQVAETDPARAVALAEGYAGGCFNLLENLVHQWAERDHGAAYAYAVKLTPGDERDRVLGRVAFIRSKESPAKAAELVAREIAPGTTQDEAAISVLHQWALREPDLAFAWAQFFPEGALRDRALKEIENLVSPPANH